MRYLVLDLGGSSIKSALLDENYQISDKKRYILSGSRYGDGVRNEKDVIWPEITSARDFALQISSVCRGIDELDGIAVSYCCPVDYETGRTFVGGETYKYLNEINLQELLEFYCHLPVSVEKDSNCMLRAEVELGSLKNCRNAIVLGLGTGIACGIYLNGKILRGTHYSVGEVSNLLIEHPDVPTLEDRWMTHSSVRWLIQEFARCKDMEISQVNGEVVFSSINAGDQDSIALLREYAQKIAVQIYNLQLLLDVDAFAIGGGISSEPALIEAIQNAVDALHARLHLCYSKPDVRQGRFYNDANLIGAAISLQNKVNR